MGKHPEAVMRLLNKLSIYGYGYDYGSAYGSGYDYGSASGYGYDYSYPSGSVPGSQCNNGQIIESYWKCDGMCDCTGGDDEDEADCNGYLSTDPYCKDYDNSVSGYGSEYSGSGYEVMKTQAKEISNTKKIHRPQNKSKSQKKGNQLKKLLKMLEMMQKK